MGRVTSGGVSAPGQQQIPRIAPPLAQRAKPSAATDDGSRMAQDLQSILTDLGLAPKGENMGRSSISIKDSLEAFINTMMGSLQQQQEQQQALQQQQLQEQAQRKVTLADNKENSLKRDLERLLETLDQPGGQGKESEQGVEAEAVNPLQSQLTKLLESSGAAKSGVTLKEVLSGLASKLPNEPAERKGYRVDTQV